MKMINVLVVDDHTIIRKGIHLALNETLDMRVTGEAKDGEEAIDLINRSTFDVVVLDLNLSNEDGIEVLKQIKTIHPALPVVILSMYPESEYAVRCIKNGASGYLNKENALKELIMAIRQVSSGKRFVSADLAIQLADSLAHNRHELPHQTLSQREYQVVCLIASGKKLSDMANIMSLSAKTVSVYRARALEKMNFKTNAELIHYAISHKLVN